MKTKLIPIVASLMALSLLLSCNKAPSPSEPGQIVFRTQPKITVDVQTKASEVNQAALVASGFKVSATTGEAESETAVWTDVAFTKGTEYFQASGGKWWPSTDPNYHFYTSNITLTHTDDGATVSATNDVDVVCAYLPDPNYNEPNTLAFKHIFARITDVTLTAVDDYTITNISVTITPKTGGTYNLRTGADQTNGTGWSDLVSGSPVTIANTTPGTKANDLYLVPGTYTVTATWTATKGNYTKTFSNRTCDIDVVGGAINSISAQLTGDASEVVFSVNVTAWGSHDIDLGIYGQQQP
jgi:hypothetical protein